MSEFDDIAGFGDGDDDFHREIAADIRAERVQREEDGIRDLQKRGKRLTLENVANPMFDRQRPVYRRVNCRGHAERAIEWVTITDQFVQVGCTYFLSDGAFSVVAFEPRNLQLFDGIVTTQEQFAKAMKSVDRAYARMSRSGRPRGVRPGPASRVRRTR